MFFSYICSYRFIPPQEIRAPKRQKSSFFNMLQCVKKSVFTMVFTAQDFSTAQNQYYFLLSPQTHFINLFHISRCKISRTRNYTACTGVFGHLLKVLLINSQIGKTGFQAERIKTPLCRDGKQLARLFHLKYISASEELISPGRGRG